MDIALGRTEQPIVQRATGEHASAQVEMLEGILRRLNGFVYRCRADDAFTMIYLTESVKQMLGYPNTDFIGNKVRSFVSVTHPDDVAMVGKEVDACLEVRQSWSIDYRLIAADGRIVWINEIGAGIFDDDGSLAFLEGAILGIDDKKQAELANQALIGTVSTMSGDIIAATEHIFGILKKLKMLAFNARIEAARVGSAGAGFNVVAQEMTALAEETSQSASDITRLTNGLNKALGR